MSSRLSYWPSPPPGWNSNYFFIRTTFQHALKRLFQCVSFHYCPFVPFTSSLSLLLSHDLTESWVGAEFQNGMIPPSYPTVFHGQSLLFLHYHRKRENSKPHCRVTHSNNRYFLAVSGYSSFLTVFLLSCSLSQSTVRYLGHCWIRVFEWEKINMSEKPDWHQRGGRVEQYFSILCFVSICLWRLHCTLGNDMDIMPIEHRLLISARWVCLE